MRNSKNSKLVYFYFKLNIHGGETTTKPKVQRLKNIFLIIKLGLKSTQINQKLLKIYTTKISGKSLPFFKFGINA